MWRTIGRQNGSIPALVASLLLVAALIGAVVVTAGCSASDESEVTILQMSTGGVSGVYYPVGRAIAKVVNQRQRELALHISAGDSHGSIENLNLLASERIDLAIVQLDQLLRARAGEAFWQGNPVTEVRALGILYTEAVTVLAAEAAGITTIDELPEHRINLGKQGSGHHHSAMSVLTAAGYAADTATSRAWPRVPALLR